LSPLLSVSTNQSPLEDSLEAITEEEHQARSSTHPPVEAEAVTLIPVLDTRKKSSAAGDEARKKSSKGEAATGKRRKSSLFLRLKNFKSLPSISLPRIFNLSKLLKKEKSQPIMTLAANSGGGEATVSAALTDNDLLTVACASPTGAQVSAPKFELGEGGVDAAAVAMALAGGWKRRRKGRIRTVVVVEEVRIYK